MKKLFGQSIFLFASAIALWSCNGDDSLPTDTEAPETQSAEVKKAYELLEKASWIKGAWQSVSPDGTAYEVWTTETDSSLTGTSFLVKGRDTMPQETIRLMQAGQDLFYIPTVNGQNGGQPISFMMSQIAADSFVFENPAHDFPQKISYRRIGNDSLEAQISGSMHGKQTAMSFPMNRVE